MSDFKAYLAALQRYNGEIEILYDEPMANHTTFHIGGPAEIFLCPRSVEAMGAAVCEARRLSLPCVTVGNGSNLLVRDSGITGVVVCTSQMREVKRQGDCLFAGAGVGLPGLARRALEESLAGLEFAGGIPGSVGGAVFMNAGAYNGQMADCVVSVQYYDESGVLQERPGHDCAFDYRTSVFKEHPLWTVTAAVLRLTPDDPAAIRTRLQTFSERRREKQPLDLPSAGSTFKRPAGHFAGRLIEEAGLKGFAVGGAQVSEKHAGFVVNRGGATCDDVLRLIEQVQKRVMECSGIALECEIRLL